MPMAVATRIDPDLCIGCGRCVTVCPSGTLTLKDGKAVVTGADSLQCGHCQAVCPTRAVTVTTLSEEASRFRTAEVGSTWLPYGKIEPGLLLNLMQSRRSCRTYSDKPVPRDRLMDLVRAGASAPSGTNCQLWTFTILPDRAAMLNLGNSVMGFFKKLNWLAAKPAARLVGKVVLKDALGLYYREYYEKVSEKIVEFETTGQDGLFHGAPAGIVIGMRPGASCPMEDALLASQNILLAAHAFGLGSCLVGFAVEAMKRDGRIKAKIGIPKEEAVYAVIALGWPKETYRSISGRRALLTRWVEK